MTHDPLCPQAYPYGRDDDLDSFFGKKDWDCRCKLIAKVVQRERKAHSERTQHLRDRIERLVTKANRWRDENADLRKQLKAMTP